MQRFWIINLQLFQLSWFLSAIYTDKVWWLLLSIMLVHFVLSPTPKEDLKLLILVPIGIAVDKVLIEVEIFETTAEIFPLWLFVVWCMFIISFNHSLKWLMSLPLGLVAIIGAIGGPLSYRLGAELGALQWGRGEINALLVLAFIWGLLLPCLVIGYRHLNVQFKLAKRGSL